jgi:hypothetical protein
MDNPNYDAAVAELVAEAIAADPNHTKNSVATKALIPHPTFERRLKVGGWKTSEIMRIAGVLEVHPASLLPEQVA